MRVWILTTGEPVPIEGATGARLLRSGYFAHLLAERGAEVTWWTSSFDHWKKAHIVPADTQIPLAPRLTVRLLHGCGYTTNVSLARWRDHRMVAGKFLAQAPEAPPPTIIVSSLPTVELSLAAVRFGRRIGVPVVLDMRDMWPDIFAEAVPMVPRVLVRLAMSPLFAQARAACAGATAITGITDAFVDWGVAKAGRSRTCFDRTFAMGYSGRVPSADALQAAGAFWDAAGVREGAGELRVCFFGTLERQFDIETVIDAARLCRASGATVTFIVCGTGSRLDQFRKAAADLDNVVFPGWVDAAQIHVLMRRSSLGLDPLPERFDFLATINNKAIEYLSAGLPVLSCPARGVLHDLLVQHDCGVSYDAGDAAGLSTLLLQLIAQPERVQALSANAGRVFEHLFLAERVYADMAAYLDELVAAAPQTRVTA